MAMSPEAQAEYDEALTAAVLKHGTLVREDPSFYGWEDFDYHLGHGLRSRHTAHHLKCEIVSTGKPVESTWHEFQGTFYEGDTSVHGIDLPEVTCACGKVQDRTFRWQARMQEVAEAVFEEAFGNRAEEKPKSKCPGIPHRGHASTDWTCPYDRVN